LHLPASFAIVKELLTCYEGKHNVEILSLVFNFDPVSFACGVASTGVITGGVAWVKAVRKSHSVKGVDAARDELLAAMKPTYAELEESFAELNETYDKVSHEFSFAYPNSTLLTLTHTKTSMEHHRTKLNQILNLINKVENTHLDKKTLDEAKKEYDQLITHFANLMQSAKYGLNEVSRHVVMNQSDLKTFQRIQKDVQSRLDTVRATLAEAETRFARVYLEKVPPAIFQAEKHLESLNEMVERYDFNTAARGNRKAVADRAVQSLGRAEKRMNAVLNYSDVARREATKKRAELRNSLAPRNADEEMVRDACILKLMDAESHDYSTGNPPEKFNEIIEIFNEYAKIRRMPLSRKVSQSAVKKAS
jgi:hypothetical protein